MKISIENFKIVNRGELKAFFDARFDFGDSGIIEFIDCRLIQDKNKKPWASPPQAQYRGKEKHEFKYFPLGSLEGKIKEEFERQAFAKYNSLLEEEGKCKV